MKKKFGNILRFIVPLHVITALLVASLWPHNANAIAFPSGWVATSSVNEVYYTVRVAGGQYLPHRTGTFVDFTNASFLDSIQFYDTNGEYLTIPENSIWSLSFVSQNCAFEGTTNNYSSNYGHFMGMTTDNTNDTDYTTFYFYNDGPSLTGYYTIPISVNCQANSRFKATQFYSFVKFDPNAGQIDYTSVLDDINDGIISQNSKLDTMLDQLSNDIGAVIINQDRQDEKYMEQYDNVNYAIEDSQSYGEESSGDAGQIGSSLLEVFSDFIGALTVDPETSDCSFSGDVGNLDLGNLNFCELSPPREIQLISSLVVVGFSVPLSLALVNKILGLFRSFQ